MFASHATLHYNANIQQILFIKRYWQGKKKGRGYNLKHKSSRKILLKCTNLVSPHLYIFHFTALSQLPHLKLIDCLTEKYKTTPFHLSLLRHLMDAQFFTDENYHVTQNFSVQSSADSPPTTTKRYLQHIRHKTKCPITKP